MGYQREREDFIARMAKHGMGADVARLSGAHGPEIGVPRKG